MKKIDSTIISLKEVALESEVEFDTRDKQELALLWYDYCIESGLIEVNDSEAEVDDDYEDSKIIDYCNHPHSISIELCDNTTIIMEHLDRKFAVYKVKGTKENITNKIIGEKEFFSEENVVNFLDHSCFTLFTKQEAKYRLDEAVREGLIPSYTERALSLFADELFEYSENWVESEFLDLTTKEFIGRMNSYVDRKDIDLANKLENLLESGEISEETYNKCMEKENHEKVIEYIWDALTDSSYKYFYVSYFDGLAKDYDAKDIDDLHAAELYNCDELYLSAIAELDWKGER